MKARWLNKFFPGVLLLLVGFMVVSMGPFLTLSFIYNHNVRAGFGWLMLGLAWVWVCVIGLIVLLNTLERS